MKVRVFIIDFPMQNDYKKSIIFMTLSSLAFAIMSFMVRLAGDLPLYEKVLFRNFVALIIALVLIAKNKDSVWGQKKNRVFLILRGLGGLGGVFFYFYSITYLNLSDGTILNKLSPFFVILFAALFLKEKLGKHKIIAITIAFLASMLIIKPHFEMDVVPAFSGLISAVFAGFAYSMIRLLNLRGEKPATIVFYFSLISFVVVLPFAVFNFVTPTPIQWLYLLGIGVFAGIGQIFLTESYRHAPASDVAPYQYMHVLFTAMISIMFLQEAPDLLSILGSLLIVGAFIYLYKKRSV
jgi:drug/metabolite transporter (DMT)-like permease